ncbi:glycerol-3-phosphate acyltransferase [Chloroflexota bacterium]
MNALFVLLILSAYFLGALPLSYLAAKLARGIDLRRYGTGQVGAGNLFRMTGSWKIGVTVGIFDVGKGALMLWVANMMGLSAFQQLIVGIAAIIGHNWSVFLKFSGGRGVGTALGVILVTPLLNSVTPWGLFSLLIIIAIGMLILRSSPLPILLGVAAVPAASWLAADPAGVTLGYLALLLTIVGKRATVPPSPDARSITKGELLLNRFLFDRDIRDRKVWMYRKPQEQEKVSSADEMRHPS